MLTNIIFDLYNVWFIYYIVHKKIAYLKVKFKVSKYGCACVELGIT